MCVEAKANWSKKKKIKWKIKNRMLRRIEKFSQALRQSIFFFFSLSELWLFQKVCRLCWLSAVLDHFKLVAMNNSYVCLNSRFCSKETPPTTGWTRWFFYPHYTEIGKIVYEKALSETCTFITSLCHINRMHFLRIYNKRMLCEHDCFAGILHDTVFLKTT